MCSRARFKQPPRPEPPVIQSQLSSDDLLRDIYSRETGAHVATVRSYIERERNAPSPHALTEDIYRACHTLSGSSKPLGPTPSAKP